MLIEQTAQTDQELLQLFFKYEMQLRKENPSLFWQLVDRLSNSTVLQISPGISAGVFYLLKVFKLVGT